MVAVDRRPYTGGIMETAKAGTACIANISLAERRRRLAFGIVTFALGVAACAALLLGGVDRWWRLALVALFYPAAVGYFQWRDHTCVALAARNQRKLGAHAESIDDADELAAVRAQASSVQRKALAAAAALVVVALLVP